MSIRSTLDAALGRLAGRSPSAAEAPRIAEARAWLARVETLLDWIAKHPTLVEFKSEAAQLILRYREESQATETAASEPDASPH
jgi:hypothetical protein